MDLFRFSSLAVVAAVALASTSAMVPTQCPCKSYCADNEVVSLQTNDVEEDKSSDYYDYTQSEESSTVKGGNEAGKGTTHERSMYCDDTSITSISGCEASDITMLSISTPSILLVPETIRGFTNLTDLRIEHFKHPKLSKIFLSGQINLTVFQISSTSLEYVDKDWFKYAPNIITLNLSNNKIRSLDPETFSYLKQLETVHLDSNALTTLPPTLFQNNPLRNLYLHENRWYCDSETVAFVQKMNHNKVNVPVLSYCAYPEELHGLDLSYLKPDDHC